MVELITVSGLYQQFAEGDRIGSYPDSIVRFEQKNPAFINPEDILVNVLALQGYDADVKTERLKSVGEVVISSGANIKNVQAPQMPGCGSTWRPIQGEPSHSLVAGLKPREILVNGKRLRHRLRRSAASRVGGGTPSGTAPIWPSRMKREAQIEITRE